MADNRIDQLGAPKSPTGTPVLPVQLVPILGALFALATAGASLFPSNTIASHVCHFIAGLSGLAGLISPGLRK